MRSPRTRWNGAAPLGIALLAVAACSSTELPGTDAGTTPLAIVIVPSRVELTLAHDKVQEQPFRAYGFYHSAPPDAGGDGPPAGGVDITDRVSWSVELSSMGRFTGNRFRTEVMEGGAVVPARHGGAGRVLASFAGTTGAAELRVKFEKAFFDAGAPKGAAGKFGGKTAASRAPRLIYPATGTMVPPNLGKLEPQWARGSGNDLFQLHFTSKLCDVRIYTAEQSYELSGAVWKAVALTSREDSVTIKVHGTKSASPSVRGVSGPVTLRVGRGDVKGGLYYWVASKTGGIYRYSFDTPGKQAQPYYTTAEAGDCIGCHAISRGGKRVAFTKSGGNGNTAILDVETRTPVLDSKYRGNIQTFSKDGSQVIVAFMGALQRRSAVTGKLLEVVPTGGGKATHPDWAPDGSGLVFVSVAEKDYTDDVHFKNGTVKIIRRSGGGWSAPEVLAKGGGGVNYYYPTFSPQGDWVALNRSTGDSYSDMDANLYVVRPSGGKLLPLSGINGTNLSNSWPRWSPFIQKYQDTTVYWLTFSSVRNYGLKLRNSAIKDYNKKVPQIWMAAFDIKRAASGKNPVERPFWLPFQDTAHHNHIAQWTEKIIAIK